MTEMWRPVPEFPAYEVSSLGRIRSLVTGRIRKTTLRGGYPRLDLWRDGTQFNRSVHVLVAAAFLGPRPDGMDVCHGDGNKLNNTPENLRYDTAAENQRDQVRLGIHANTRKTHCPQGHPYSPENTYRHRDGRRRSCRACHVERLRARRSS